MSFLTLSNVESWMIRERRGSNVRKKSSSKVNILIIIIIIINNNNNNTNNNNNNKLFCFVSFIRV